MARLWALAFLFLPALGQSALSPVRDHPLARQAQALLQAAESALQAQASPVALSLQGNYARLGYECTPQALCSSLPATGGSLTLALVLTPLPLGDTADGVERARLALRRAELGYRKALTALQAQAVAAWGRYRQALLAQALAEKGVELAEKALEAAQRRQANPKELREAALSLKEAQARLEEARRGLALARKGAEGLVDPESPLPEIPPPKGTTPLAVEEARLALAEAQIARQAAWRALWPQLQASYLFYPSGNDTLSLSLSSRTLQPTLAYTRQDPARQATQVPGVGSYRTAEELRVSLSLTLSPGLFAALEGAEAQVRGAAEALRAAEAQAQVQGESLRLALEGAQANLALAQARLQSQEKSLEEAKRRLELGLESPLGLLQAELNLLQARLALAQAENDLRNRIMELYQFYGELLPEVSP